MFQFMELDQKVDIFLCLIKQERYVVILNFIVQICVVSGFYVIDFDGEGGYEFFIVFCDMMDKNRVGVIVVSYDSEERMLVDGYDDEGSYVCCVYYIGVGLLSVV